MRFLHTSDWHLGRSFHREGMTGHQAAWIDHLVQTARAEKVDAVLLSGDVFDRALPPVDAVALADEALARLAAAGVRVVVTSGNHDSAIRLGSHSRLIDAAGVHLRTALDEVGTPVLFEDAHGPVAVHGLPYLDPGATAVAWGLQGRSHDAALNAAMTRVHHDLSARPGARAVVLAHAFVAGGQPSDSERDIAVGGVDRVPTTVFDGVDYVALGHLHGRQQSGERIRYSGSPLAYSFSERSHTKGSWLVELGRAGEHGAHLSAEFVPAPVPRRLATLRGRLEDLLLDPHLAEHEDAWVQVVLTDPLRPAAPMERLRQRFPHTLLLGFEPEGEVSSLPRPRATGRSAEDRQIGLEFVEAVRGVPARPAEAALLQQAYDACCADPDLAAENAHTSTVGVPR